MSLSMKFSPLTNLLLSLLIVDSFLLFELFRKFLIAIPSILLEMFSMGFLILLAKFQNLQGMLSIIGLFLIADFLDMLSIVISALHVQHISMFLIILLMVIR